jgi:DNA-binding MarR family transcriptional regulator
MLQVKGFPGRDWVSVGELTERLQARHHGVVALLGRCEAPGLVTRTPGSDDRRVVEVRLTPLGDRLVGRVAALHQRELQSLSGVFRVARLTMLNDRAGETQAARRVRNRPGNRRRAA